MRDDGPEGGNEPPSALADDPGVVAPGASDGASFDCQIVACLGDDGKLEGEGDQGVDDGPATGVSDAEEEGYGTDVADPVELPAPDEGGSPRAEAAPDFDDRGSRLTSPAGAFLTAANIPGNVESGYRLLVRAVVEASRRSPASAKPKTKAHCKPRKLGSRGAVTRRVGSSSRPSCCHQRLAY